MTKHLYHVFPTTSDAFFLQLIYRKGIDTRKIHSLIESMQQYASSIFQRYRIAKVMATC